MDKKSVITGIKRRLYSECELRPSEVLVLKDYIEELEKENQELLKELEKSYSYEDPVLRGLDEFREMYTPENWVKRMADRDRVMGIPLEGEK